MGAVLHTINPRLPARSAALRRRSRRGRRPLLRYHVPQARAVSGQQPNPINHYVALTDAAHLPADSGIPGLRDYEELIAAEPDTFDWPALDEQTASSLCYTSGTAGFPKGVLYSHRSTVIHSYAICMPDALGICAGDAVLPVVPMFHVNAWGVPYAAAMTGAKLVLPGPGPRCAEPARADRAREARRLPARRADGVDGPARACSPSGQAALLGSSGS